MVVHTDSDSGPIVVPIVAVEKGSRPQAERPTVRLALRRLRAGLRQSFADVMMQRSVLSDSPRQIGGFIVLALVFNYAFGANYSAVTTDIRIDVAAVALIAQGGNPYDTPALARTELRLYPHITPDLRASILYFSRRGPYVEGPAAMFARPLLGWPSPLQSIVFAVTYLGLIVLALALIAAGGGGVALTSPWRRSLSLGLAPTSLIALAYGQMDALILCAVAGALLVRHRFHAHAGGALAAGLLLTLGLIKPQVIAGPVLLLAFLYARDRRLLVYLAGLGLGAGVQCLAMWIWGGPYLLTGWPSALLHFDRNVLPAQWGLASLSALYLRWTPAAMHMPLELGAVLLWCGAILLCGRYVLRPAAVPSSIQVTGGQPSVAPAREAWWLALGLASWMLAIPYAHPYHDAVLGPAIWYAAANEARTRRRALLYLSFLVLWWVCPLLEGIPLLEGTRAHNTAMLADALARALHLPIAGFGVFPVLLLVAILWIQRPLAESHAKGASGVQAQLARFTPERKGHVA